MFLSLEKWYEKSMTMSEDEREIDVESEDEDQYSRNGGKYVARNIFLGKKNIIFLIFF